MCTWEGCDKPPKHKHTARDGEVWSNLCDTHEIALCHAQSLPHRFMFPAWVKAQGGSQIAAQRSLSRDARVAEALAKLLIDSVGL